MEIIELQKMAKIDKALEYKLLKLEIEDVITGKIKKVSYDIFCEKYYNRFFDYLFYVNGDFFGGSTGLDINDILLNEIKFKI